MKIQVDVKPYELEDDDTIAGYKIKDVATIAYCMRAQGVTEKEVGNFVRNLENAYNMAIKDAQDALDNAFIQWRQNE